MCNGIVIYRNSTFILGYFPWELKTACPVGCIFILSGICLFILECKIPRYGHASLRGRRDFAATTWLLHSIVLNKIGVLFYVTQHSDVEYLLRKIGVLRYFYSYSTITLFTSPITCGVCSRFLYFLA